MNTREVSLSAIVAALYAAIVILLAPISFGPIQLRLADCLIPLSAIMGPPAVIGVTLGALVANTYWFLSPIDVLFGAAANLAGGYIVYRFRDRLVLASVAASLVIGVVVGGYLWLFFPPPSIMGLQLPAWFAMMVSLTLSSLVAVTVLGVALVRTLERSGYVKQLRSDSS